MGLTVFEGFGIGLAVDYYKDSKPAIDQAEPEISDKLRVLVHAARKGVRGMDEKGTMLIELFLAAMIIFAVGVALVLPSISARYPIGF